MTTVYTKGALGSKVTNVCEIVLECEVEQVTLSAWFRVGCTPSHCNERGGASAVVHRKTCRYGCRSFDLLE